MIRDFLGFLQDTAEAVQLMWQRDLRHSRPMHLINGLVFATAIAIIRYSDEVVLVDWTSLAFFFMCVVWFFYGLTQMDRYAGRT